MMAHLDEHDGGAGSDDRWPDVPLIIDNDRFDGLDSPAPLEPKEPYRFGQKEHRKSPHFTGRIKMGFIVNLEAGNFDLGTITHNLGEWASEHEISFDMHFLGDEHPLSKRIDWMIDKGAQIIVAVGGDGTAAQVATELQKREVPMGVVPAGTANGVAVALGIPLDIEQALNLLSGDHHARPIDVIRVGERVFLISLSAGISSQSVEQIDTHDKERFGVLAYYLSGLSKAISSRAKRFTIELDGEVLEDQFLEVAILNMGVMGLPDVFLGGDIAPDDGLLRVFAVSQATLPGAVWKYMQGKQSQNPRVRLQDVKQVKISGDADTIVQADGDVIGALPIEAEIVPRAVDVIVPGD